MMNLVTNCVTWIRLQVGVVVITSAHCRLTLDQHLASVRDIRCWSQLIRDCIISPQEIYAAGPSLSGIVLYHPRRYTLLVPAYLRLYYITPGDIHCWSRLIRDCIISPQGIYAASPSLSGIVLYHHRE